jgi:hypothetical protein
VKPEAAPYNIRVYTKYALSGLLLNMRSCLKSAQLRYKKFTALLE